MDKLQFFELISCLPQLRELNIFESENLTGLSSRDFFKLINQVGERLEKLEGLHITKLDPFNWESDELLVNSQILSNLQTFSYNSIEKHNQSQLETICNRLKNVKNLKLDYEVFYPSELNQLLLKLESLRKLETLTTKFYTPSTGEYLNQLYLKSQVLVDNFNFQKLKVFSFKYLQTIRSYRSPFNAPELILEFKFKNYPTCLTHLTLPKIDGELLTQLSIHCPKLVEIIMESSLPLPSPSYHSLISLARVCATSFSEECISSPGEIRKIMPKVSNFNLKSSYQNNTQLNYISKVFPNLSTLAINGAIPNINELLSLSDFKRANWKQICIFRFDHSITKLLQLLKLLSYPIDFIKLIPFGLQSNEVRSSKFIYKQFKDTVVFSGFMESEFQYVGVKLINRC
ncbi:hypothetical protein CONCODRAFT_6114 [Conidiobolus coronatus NRRL 28638]|uniref:RNI-like protein n=1 Tax=Conidiobolus coronatus (strain ATCC 28846 / CBS 209.66 / NRRL 28638) TaxID=796925 RepID=A0A137P8G5_CONC2|nr:hypothetical protein CONCODRAFT_6114 [Conidiobolus coronatus NRRL 28638]|eukprot:KXN71221.1 hypothetical protein CONCODRAFT_6114 [Conidiobolus coronatus NRRL 28638]